MLAITIEGTIDKVLKELDMRSQDELTIGSKSYVFNGKLMKINQIQTYRFYGKLHVSVELVDVHSTEEEVEYIRSVSYFKHRV